MVCSALRGFVVTLALCGAARARPLLVATLPDLAALCREVAGQRAAVEVLIQDGEDPLRAAARPEQALLLGRADLLVTLGGALEAPWLRPLLVQARNPRVLEPLEARRALPPGDDLYPLGDPRAGAPVARAIAAQLAAVDPAGAQAYRTAADALAQELAERQRAWLPLLLPLRGARVVTLDGSFRAFLGWAGLGEATALGPAPGEAPTALRALAALRSLREAPGPRLVLQREHEPPALGRLLAARAGAALVVVPLGARAGRGERYIEGLERLVHQLAGALAERRGP